MNADVFVDTNILLYSIDEDPANLPKRNRAQQLLLGERWGWSVQVAAEFFVNATSPKRPFRLASPDAAAFVETWLAFPTAVLTPDVVRAAIALHQRFGLSYWDAAILAAAAQLRCHTVFSEDLNHGQDYDGVRVLNPFLSGTPVQTS
jgi:predicted nucleic acid-binding protein